MEYVSLQSQDLVSHLNHNEKCNKEFCMPEFRKEYSNYRHRIRMKKHEIKQKEEDKEKFNFRALGMVLRLGMVTTCLHKARDPILWLI